MHFSQASLDDVRKVECFIEPDGDSQSCIGVIIEYSNDRIAALGECRLGMSKSVRINAPTMLLLKPSAGENLHSRAWLSSSSCEAVGLQSRGWERRQMSGTLVWWFGVNVMEIVHSVEAVLK